MILFASASVASIALAIPFLLPVASGQSEAAAESEAAEPMRIEREEFEALKWREVGPYRGGRSAACTGIPGDPHTYYFGAAGGGVWKTKDGGAHWENISDGSFGGSIGAVTVAPSDPNVIYVGGGEVTVRGNVSHGNGVWKSVDAGRTWRHMGLADSRRIPRIRVHPANDELVYVAALGHLFGPNEERGVYRSRDGGETWEAILQVDENVGAVDLVMDPANPRILYASTWRVRRTPYSLDSGGEGSALWKSIDGGDTWTDLSETKGFPKGPIGIIGVSVSASDPDNVYAIVEAEKGGVLRSRDAGETWSLVNTKRDLRQRAWYYTRIYADPIDADSVYVLNVQFHHSRDGGKSFNTIRVPHGDNHDMWIDPADPLRMIEANDGGANVSLDGGTTWSTQSNQPTAQMYRVSVDDAFPYRILGGQQDNSAVRIRSRSFSGSVIGERDWEPTAGGESGHIVAKPGEPDIVYGGSYDGFLTRVDHRTGEQRAVNVWPDNPMGWGAAELRYRFNWNFPIFFSPHDPELLYAAGNVLFSTRDEGATWQAISPDLTRNEKSMQESSGGPITQDNTSVEYYSTIFAACESSVEAGVLWTGSDDGLVQLSRDAGASWQDVTPGGMPEWTMINSIEAHPHLASGLYVAATGYKKDDFAPYLFRTTDWGQTWERIDAGIPRDHFTRVVRADPLRAGLLYAGTERGVHLSFDDGSTWESLQRELPIVPVTDMVVKEGDLVVATQGRGYWILDDLNVLRQWMDEITAVDLHLFRPEVATRLLVGGTRDNAGAAGTNPSSGLVIHYWLGQELPEGAKLRLDITESKDSRAVIASFEQKAPEGSEEKGPPKWLGIDPRQLTSDKGLNRFVWDLRHRPAEAFDDMVLWNSRLSGPRVIPDWYSVRMSLELPPPVAADAEASSKESSKTRETSSPRDWSPIAVAEPKRGSFVREVGMVRQDPRSTASREVLGEQHDFLISIRDQLTDTHRGIRKLRRLRSELTSLQKRFEETTDSELDSEAERMITTLKEIEETLYQTKSQSRQDPLNFPIRLNDKLAGVMGLAGIGERAPTQQMREVRQELGSAIQQQLDQLDQVFARELPAFETRVRELQVPYFSRSTDE